VDGQPVQAEFDRYVWVNFPSAPDSHGKSADEALQLQLALLDDRLEHV
jgi:hypothetical protein